MARPGMAGCRLRCWRRAVTRGACAPQVADLVGADPKEIIFTSGATESNNMSIKGVANFYKDKKRHIITTQTERARAHRPKQFSSAELLAGCLHRTPVLRPRADARQVFFACHMQQGRLGLGPECCICPVGLGPLPQGRDHAAWQQAGCS